MISNTIAYLISLKYQPVPLFDMFSRQDGTDLPSMEEQRETRNAAGGGCHAAAGRGRSASRRTPLPMLFAKPVLHHAEFFLVSHRSGDWSSVTKETLRGLAKEGKGDSPLARVLPGKLLPWLHPDQPLDAALREIGDWPIIPVIHRADFNNLQGIISLADILATYGAATGKAYRNEASIQPSGQQPALSSE